MTTQRSPAPISPDIASLDPATKDPAAGYKKKLALAIGLFSFTLIATRINVLAGALASAFSNVLYARIILPDNAPSRHAIIGRPLNSFHAGQKRPVWRRLACLFCAQSAPKIR